jgi:hypothetical protein
MLYGRIQVLEIELDDSNTAREKEVLVNETNTLKCVLGHLYNQVWRKSSTSYMD